VCTALGLHSNMHEAYTLRGSLRECHMNGPVPAAPVPAAAGILVTAGAAGAVFS